MNVKLTFYLLLFSVNFLCGCEQNDQLILIDGSSTVYPISEAVAEEFLKIYPEVTIAIGESGTGGGFAKLARREINISNASRPITAAEIEECRKNNIQFIES